MQSSFVFANRFAIWDTMAFFYAVARGRNPGVYSTWGECKAEVDKFPAPIFKKFPTKSEAENFIRSRGGSTSLSKSREDQFVPQVSPVKKTEMHLLHDTMEKRLKDWAMLRDEMSQVDIQVKASKIAAELGIKNFNPLGGWLKYHVECNPRIYKALRIANSSVSSDAADNASSEQDVKLTEKLNSLESKISGVPMEDRSIPSRIKFLESTLLSMNQELNEIKRFMSTDIRVSSVTSANRKRKKIADFEEDDNSDDALNNIDLEDSGSVDKFDVDSDGYVNVYTDGACSGNGKSIAFAGIGVWFGDNHSLNVSRPVADGSRATNNLAEIQAVTAAARQASKAGIKKLKINTDSQFLISCITQWMPKWKRNGWKTTGGKDVINKVELIEMENAIKPLIIAWNHVRGHAGVHGNEMADKLARAGAQQQRN